jgi:hypothetical protein
MPVIPATQEVEIRRTTINQLAKHYDALLSFQLDRNLFLGGL